ncbi:insulinase family protein [Pseudidiomarina sediminum]|uniref:insulinase family protein n=1 Tax=Pseudidiomarina sediminum TaxID=431675 RepID=UPI001C937A80|nr:insulinase family protein [Pseudidiomarina sediminum]MBY6063471.1 insulinase family protein [Pseudidiomarina sediminum]
MEPSNSLNHFTDIIQSPTDHRSYAMVTLANGLRCTLVHDPKAELCTAALAVAAGHFQDPIDTQGLAHFLEHMLFLGTEKYPSATDYQNFIHQHGGHHNAWTGTEFSNYYFSCEHSAFDEALDRFARFFYQPTFNANWLAKEVHSIESEFQLKRKDELRRLYQVHKATANPAHPFAKFSVGNLSTLTQDGSTHGLAKHMRTFFDTWYRANRMTLVLAGSASLETLHNYAEQHFTAIAGGGPAVQAETQPLYLPEQLGIQLNVQPLKDARRLILAFALPGIDHDYPYKTTSFIAHVLGYEGPGSLFAELHRRNLINSLSAGGGISGSNFKDFNLNMQLTDEGLQDTDTVIEHVFAAIRQVQQQGLEDWRYQERQVAIANAFRFQEPARTADLAPQLAINMHHYQPRDLIFGDYRMERLNTDKAHELLNLMTPERVRVTHIHRQVAVNDYEPIYGTNYRVTALSDAQQQRWQTPAVGNMRLPKANPYLQPLQAPLPLLATASAIPEYHHVSQGCRLWLLQDPDFRAPKAHIYCQFTLPQATASARHYACARLWCELMIDRLNEALYDAEMAGLHFNVYPQHYGITLHLSGYSNGIAALACEILQHFLVTEFRSERWHDLHQKLQSNWQSALANKPLNLLFARLNVLLQPHMYALSDLAAAVAEVTPESFADWQNDLFQQAEVKLFAHGDLTWQRVSPLLQQLTSNFPLMANLQAGVPPTRDFAELKRSGRLLERGHIETRHHDHAALLVLQGASCDVMEQTVLLLLNQFIQPHLFSQLRTHEQLGYLVGSTYMPIEQRPHVLLYVQSNQYDAQHLSARIDVFMQGFTEQLLVLADEELEAIQRALVRQLREPDTNLRLRSQRLWSAISQEQVVFDRLEQMAQLLESHTTSFFAEKMLTKLSDQSRQGFITAKPKEL